MQEINPQITRMNINNYDLGTWYGTGFLNLWNQFEDAAKLVIQQIDLAGCILAKGADAEIRVE